MKLDAPFWLPTAKDHWAAQAKHAEKKIRTKKRPRRFRLAIRVRGGNVGVWVGEIKIFGLKSARTGTIVTGCPSGLWRAT